jgi:hypothetical protein
MHINSSIEVSRYHFYLVLGKNDALTLAAVAWLPYGRCLGERLFRLHFRS